MFVILTFSEHHVEWAVDLIGWVMSLVPTLSDRLQLLHWVVEPSSIHTYINASPSLVVFRMLGHTSRRHLVSILRSKNYAFTEDQEREWFEYVASPSPPLPQHTHTCKLLFPSSDLGTRHRVMWPPPLFPSRLCRNPANSPGCLGTSF